MRRDSGFTLTEMLVTAAVTGIALFALVETNLTRMRSEQALWGRQDVLGDQLPATLTALRISRDLERADRVRILNTGIATQQPFTSPYLGQPGAGAADIQMQFVNCPTTPCAPSDFDNAANYQWFEYRWRHDPLAPASPATNQDQVWVFPPGCAPKQVIGRQIPSLTFRYRAAGLTPPDGNPAPAVFPGSSTNVLEYVLTWDNGLAGADHRSRTFNGQATSRAIPYSDVNAGAAGLGDSGTAQAPSTGVGAPPAPCP